MATSEQQAPHAPPSPEVVGNAFVTQYYRILHQSPELVHRFYQDMSNLGRPEDDGVMSVTTTMTAIDEKILSLKYGEIRAEIKTVDAQESYNGGVLVLVTGHLTGKDNVTRNFTQTFFLAPQDNGYFVLNDMFRYVEDVNSQDEYPGSVDEVEEQAPPVHENHVSEQTSALAEEANGEEVYNPSENGEHSDLEEEAPVAEVVDVIPDGSQMVAESNAKIEEVPKKSYASIVMKESAMTSAIATPASLKSVPKSLEQQVTVAPPAPVAEKVVSSSNASENGNNQEGEPDGCSIYIKGLPLNATNALLEAEFKKFGPIKSGGIQVRSNKGFCFGFVEFEVPSAVQSALEASPIMISGRQAVVEEKRSTNTRGNNRGRFQPGRGAGFRTEGARGRGNYGGGRNYSRGDFNNRSEFGNRGNSRGGFSNRAGDGYQRADHTGSNGGRVTRAGGLTGNETAKTVTPRVSARA